MQATAELQVVPLGDGVSVRTEVARVVELLNGSGLLIETHAAGTNIEGEMSVILDVIKTIHETMHQEGSVRLISFIKLETRTDKVTTLAGKKL